MPVKKKTSSKSSSASSKAIKLLKEQMKELKAQMTQSSGARLENNIEELNEQLNKMISININLQSKMTELLIKVTDLIRENRELIGLLEEASETEEEGEASVGFDSLLIELKKIEKNTSNMGEANNKLADYVKNLYTKRLLTKAIKGKIGEEEETNVPLPEPEEEVSTVGEF